MVTLHCHGVTGGIKLSERHYYPATSLHEHPFYTRDILVETDQGQVRLVLFATVTTALDLSLPGITIKPTLTVVPLEVSLAAEPLTAAA